MSLGSKALKGRGELEWPEEVVSLLELGSESGDFMDKILNARDSVLSKDGLNDIVVSQGNSRAVNLAVASLVDELLDGCLGWVSIGNVRLNASEHVDGGLVQSNEHSVVQLSQSEELQDLLVLGVKLVDTKVNGQYQIWRTTLI